MSFEVSPQTTFVSKSLQRRKFIAQEKGLFQGKAYTPIQERDSQSKSLDAKRKHFSPLIAKIKKCGVENELFELYRSQGSKFNQTAWGCFFDKWTCILTGKNKQADVVKDKNLYLEALNGATKAARPFKPFQIAKILFIYGAVFGNKNSSQPRIQSFQAIENFLLVGLETAIKEMTFLDVRRISTGLKVFRRTVALQSTLKQVYKHIKTQDSPTLSALVAYTITACHHRYDYGLKLWSKIQMDKLDKTSLLGLLDALAKMLPNEESKYYPDFDFSLLVSQIKQCQLSNVEFARAFLAICRCEYVDEEWFKKAREMRALAETEPEVKTLLLLALLKYQKMQTIYRV